MLPFIPHLEASNKGYKNNKTLFFWFIREQGNTHGPLLGNIEGYDINPLLNNQDNDWLGLFSKYARTVYKCFTSSINQKLTYQKKYLTFISSILTLGVCIRRCKKTLHQLNSYETKTYIDVDIKKGGVKRERKRTNPRTWRPPSWTAWETRPIRPTLPPPYTKSILFSTFKTHR